MVYVVFPDGTMQIDIGHYMLSGEYVYLTCPKLASHLVQARTHKINFGNVQT